eukprot:5022817-Amphidinium_carterae.1
MRSDQQQQQQQKQQQQRRRKDDTNQNHQRSLDQKTQHHSEGLNIGGRVVESCVHVCVCVCVCARAYARVHATFRFLLTSEKQQSSGGLATRLAWAFSQNALHCMRLDLKSLCRCLATSPRAICL